MRSITSCAIATISLTIGSVTVGCAPPAPGPPAPLAQVIDVIDGDTIVVRSGQATESVRLIGIDTPEIAHHGNTADCFGPEAAARTAALVPVGSVVRLARDVEARDRYGRLLAYVQAPDGRLVNLTLAAEGYATELAIAPNLTTADQIAGAVQQARTAERGLWGRCEAAS